MEWLPCVMACASMWCPSGPAPECPAPVLTALAVLVQLWGLGLGLVQVQVWGLVLVLVWGPVLVLVLVRARVAPHRIPPGARVITPTPASVGPQLDWAKRALSPLG
jgi:hypothetical protein